MQELYAKTSEAATVTNEKVAAVVVPVTIGEIWPLVIS